MFVIQQAPARTLSWWYGRRESIDMDPPYQRRGGIWNATDQAFLIDSILNGFDIPKVYVADFTYTDSPLNRKKTQYAMIDGKQRFEAISGFFEGKVLLDKTFVYRENVNLPLAGLSYQDLKSTYPEVAERFENFNLSVMSVITDEEDKISELFVRLNRSKSLTGAEIRNAMAGPVPGLIRDVAAHRFFTLNVKFDTSRGEAQNAAAKLLLTEFRGQLVNVKKPDLDGFVEEAIRVEAPVSDFQQVALRTMSHLDRLSEVFTVRDPLLGSQGPPVVYYWMARYIDNSNLGRMRTFLVQFEEARRKNRAFVKRGEAVKSDEFFFVSDLIQFDSFSRSTNDAASLQGRLNILLRWFRDWLIDPRNLNNLVAWEWEFAVLEPEGKSELEHGVLHIVRGDSGWGVKSTLEADDESVHATQELAKRYAKDVLRQGGGGQIVIHRPNGSIRDVDTVLPA